MAKQEQIKVVGKIDLPPKKEKPANVKKFERAKEVSKVAKEQAPKKERKPKKEKNSIGLITGLNPDVSKPIVKAKPTISKTTLKLMEKYGCKTIEEYRVLRKKNKLAIIQRNKTSIKETVAKKK